MPVFSAVREAFSVPFLMALGLLANSVFILIVEVDELTIRIVLVETLFIVIVTVLPVGVGHLVAETRRQGTRLIEFERAKQQLVLEEERRRIVRDLHDVAAHHLAGVSVRSRTAVKIGDLASLIEASSFVAQATEELLRAMR